MSSALAEKDIKVLMITVRADFGGGPEHLYQLITNLPPNVKVYIAAPEDKPYYQRFSSVAGRENLIAIPHRKFTVYTLFRIISFLRRNKIDYVHSHGKGAGIYSRALSLLTGIPVIHTFHGIHVENTTSIKNKMYIMLERVLSKFTLRIIAVSKGEYDKAIKLKIAHPSKISIIENGVPLPNEKVNALIFTRKPHNILAITRFDNAKNTELLIPVIDALIELKEIGNFHFIILGKGETEQSFRQKVEEKEYSNYITFAGTSSNPSEYYLKSFCYISTSKWEGLPLAVMEAMSYGLPVLATDVRGNNDLIDHGLSGFLYQLDKPARAASILTELSRNHELWLRVSGESERKIKSRYSVKRMADETLKLYLSIK